MDTTSNKLNVTKITKCKYGEGCESGNIYTDTFFNLDAEAEQRMRDQLIAGAICDASDERIEVDLQFNDEPMQHFIKCKGGQRRLKKLRVHRYQPTKKSGGITNSKVAVWNSSDAYTLQAVRRNYVRFAKLDSATEKKTICLQFDDEKPRKFRNGEEITDA